jgi:hypothetical protein
MVEVMEDDFLGDAGMVALVVDCDLCSVNANAMLGFS